MKQWIYVVFRYFYDNPKEFVDWLNDHGSMGWELVAITSYPRSNECVFKREEPVDAV